MAGNALGSLAYSKSRRRRWQDNARVQESLAGYVFAGPWLLGFVLFTMVPVFTSIYFSFCNYQIVDQPKWIGLKNYVDLFTADPLFLKSLWNTVYMVIFGVPIGMSAGLGIAMLMNQQVKGLPVIRTVYYLPSQISGVALGMLWGWILNPQFGVVSTFFWEVFGVKAPLWLGSTEWVKPSLIMMGLWGVGGAMIIWLAGLQGIPQIFYEAAQVDGANKWTMFRNITLPLLSPSTFFVLTTGIIGTFQVFTQIFVLTNGGPDDASLVYVLQLYNQAFQFFRMGYAAAMAWVLFAIIMAVTLVQIRFAQNWVYYDTVKE